MPFFSRAKKTIKRGARAATKAVGKRYKMSYGRKGLKVGKNSVAKIAKDVMFLKSRLNAEKKFRLGDVQLGNVAQMNFNALGFQTHDLTPLWSQGLTETNRIGNSLKLTGFNMKIQLRGEFNTYTARRLKMLFIKTTDTTSSLTSIVQDMLDPNPLTGIVDYHSNWDYSDNKRVHKVIRTVPMYLPQNDIATQNVSFKAIKDYNISLKLNDILRFETNASTSPNDYRFFILILCDTGNYAATNSTNPGCMIPEAFTGVEYQFHNKFWYLDN